MWGLVRIAVVTSALTSACASPHAQNDVQTERTGPAAWRLTLTALGVTDPAQGQRLLQPEARRICGAETARFGRYKFHTTASVDKDGTRLPGTLTLVQDLTCGAAPPAPPKIPPQTGAGFVKNDAEIVRLTEAFLSSLTEGDPRAAYDLASEGLHGGAMPEEWSKHVAAGRKRDGRPGRRRIAKVTWYEDPPSAPEPGIYAAADYVASAEQLHFECGYVVWFRGGDGRFRAVRHERNFASKGDVPNATPQKIAELRAMLQCIE